MIVNMKLMLAGVFFLAAACEIQAAEYQNQQRHFLECWHCSSSTHGSAGFCSETFDEDAIPREMHDRNITALRRCNSTINSEHERAVCRKTVEETNNGTAITKRFCYYTNKSDTLDHCTQEPTDNSVRRVFCEDCLTDRCNLAGREKAAMLAVLMLPVVLVKSFLA